jgi:hypothetical protein
MGLARSFVFNKIDRRAWRAWPTGGGDVGVSLTSPQGVSPATKVAYDYEVAYDIMLSTDCYVEPVLI